MILLATTACASRGGGRIPSDASISADLSGDAREEDRPFADMVYDITCQEALSETGMGCLATRRVIHAFTGDDGVSVACSVASTADSHTLNFEVQVDFHGEAFGVRLDDAEFGVNGLITGTSCVLSFTEGSNVYRGDCGSSPPSTPQPCQLTDLFLEDDALGNPAMTGNILCEHMQLSADPVLERNREFSNSEGGSPHQPFFFSLSGCEGL